MSNCDIFSPDEKKEIFEYAVDNGILDLQKANELMQMKKREIALQEHEQKIWQGNNGRWCTHIYVDGKRKLLSKATKEDLENEIIKMMRQEQYNPTVDDLYKYWIAEKLKNEEIIDTTVHRYERQYEQCIGEFGKRRAKNITPWDLEEHIRAAIHDHKLTTKGFSNYRTILRGIFKQAKKQGLIDWSVSNTLADMDISRKAFRVIKHTDDELVFTDDEKERIEAAIDKWGYDSINLAILVLFKSGCRPSEVTALTPDCLTVKSVKVDRMEAEIHDKKGTHYEVVDRVKTDAGYRDIPLPGNASWIVKRIHFMSSNGEYCFEKNGKRINQRQLRERLSRLCKKAEVTHKSPNKIRKTYVSELLDQRVEPSIVTKVVGHTDIKTTEKYYHKNRFSDEEIASRINAINL